MATPDPDRTYMHDPLIPETIVPNEEQRFASRDEAEKFFNLYACTAGFDVRITKTRKTLRELSCNKQGHHEFYKPDEDRVREKMSGRCECKAFVKIKWNQKKDYWFFERVRLEHNHQLNPSPSVKQFLRTQKNKDPIVMEIVDQMHRCDASHNTTVNVLSEIFRGRQNFTFNEMDLKNRKAAAAREERENDIPKLLEFFKEMKAQNEYFYYEVQVDKQNVIKNVFWSHASQRAEYRDFGDVVTFDTTYKTNMYSMPLALFVGSNHQLQNVVFGQALLQDEQANTFEWLFKAFQDCMSGSRDPRCILTDQDSSMAAAIKKVFKKTQHRLCRWHMLKKYKAELKKLYKLHEGLKIKLLTVINHPLTPTEFESAWNELVDEYGLREDDTINGLWNSRKLWVAAYLKPLYCGRMTSTQRSESVNQMIKNSGFTGHMTCMSKFARRMLDFIQHTNHTAAGETHWSQAGNLRLTLQPFDGHLSRVYTRAVYKNYRETYMYSTAFRIDPHPSEVDVYLLDNIPSDYIMKRYTRGARSVVTWDRHDIVSTELGCESDQYKTRKLVQLAMTAIGACRKTSIGFGRGCEQLIALAEWAETIAADTGPSNVGDCASAQDMTCQTGSVHRRKQEQKVESEAGNKLLMMNQNPENASKKRGASGSLRGKMGRKRGRPPTARQLEEEFDDVA
ncbi:unnamed protein product [Urochloa decumbens]|uniref:Protein FAR1-RELATED SEQUENCE n=1 Tax=Urochloa decumbens TaxID=240449 RepID=A0ABC9H838_9POAL